MDHHRAIPLSHRGGMIKRALPAIAGIDAERMATCPGNDRLFAF